jgi:hypothetical protein
MIIGKRNPISDQIQFRIGLWGKLLKSKATKAIIRHTSIALHPLLVVVLYLMGILELISSNRVSYRTAPTGSSKPDSMDTTECTDVDFDALYFGK